MVGAYKVDVSLNEHKQAVISVGDKQIIADAAVAFGRTGEGMTPAELLIGALGACQVIVAKLYAQKFDIDLQQISVELEGESATVQDEKRIPTIKFKTHIESNSPIDKVHKYLEFVEKNCVIGSTLKNEVVLVSEQVNVQPTVSSI